MKKRILILLILLQPVFSLFAQVPPPPDYGEDAGVPGGPATPIDQYIIFMVIIAVAIAYYFTLHQKRKIIKS